MSHRIAFVNRSDLAELAEAVGIQADKIVAAVDEKDGSVMVIFTRDEHPTMDSELSLAVCERDADKIVRCMRRFNTGDSLKSILGSAAEEMKPLASLLHELGDDDE